MLDYEFFYIISTPIYIFFLIVFIWKKIKVEKIILTSIFYFYIISLLTVTIFPIPIQGLNEVGIYAGDNNNYIPFLSILDILINDNLGTIIKIKQIVGNIVLFLPMGFFIPLIWKSKDYFKKALLIGLGFSFCIELLQYIISLILGFNYKVTDIDDILLNTLGFIIGFFLYKLFQKSLENKN
ncbi:MAG: VanZ family protein [Candidatus Gracilibacteria bacterium]|nr:VanZ family protein [Candidatus Gracilibacteria bacterium]